MGEVEFSTQEDRWGCWPSPGSDTWVAVDYDENKFRSALLADSFTAPSKKVKPATAERTSATAQQARSTLSATEKEFLKVARAARDILKIEERKAAGEHVDKNQLKKIGKKRIYSGGGQASRAAVGSLLGCARDV